MLRYALTFGFLVLSLLAARAAADAMRTRGRVIDAATRAPLEGVTVYGDDAELAVTTDADGAFELLSARPVAAVTVVGLDYEVAVIETTGAELMIELARTATAGANDGEVIEISGGRLVAAPGAVTVERAEVTRLPGSRGDVLSGVKNLPGIANNGSLTPLSAGLIIRGASPEDSQILVDGFEIPVLYHFLGVQSVLPSEMIEDIEYQPGTFGTSHGRASGGLVAITSRDGGTEHGGFAELSFVNAAGLVQGPLGERGSYAFAGRRSVIDAILLKRLARRLGSRLHRLPDLLRLPGEGDLSSEAAVEARRVRVRQ